MLQIDRKTGQVFVTKLTHIKNNYKMNLADYLPRIEFCVNYFLSEDQQYHNMTLDDVYNLYDGLDIRSRTVIEVDHKRIRILQSYVIKLLANLAAVEDNLVSSETYGDD